MGNLLKLAGYASIRILRVTLSVGLERQGHSPDRPQPQAKSPLLGINIRDEV